MRRQRATYRTLRSPGFPILLVSVLFVAPLNGGSPAPVAFVDRLPPRLECTPEPFSPAKWRSTYVTNPRPAESVPGAITVNVKTACGRAVPELTLSVTLLDGAGNPRRKTAEQVVNEDFIMSQSTRVMCKDHETPILFQGVALGASYEPDPDEAGSHKPFEQIKFGNKVTENCGY